MVTPCVDALGRISHESENVCSNGGGDGERSSESGSWATEYHFSDPCSPCSPQRVSRQVGPISLLPYPVWCSLVPHGHVPAAEEHRRALVQFQLLHLAAAAQRSL